MSFLSLARIPDQIGYLVMNEAGAIISSGGDLENDERTAEAIYSLLTISDKIEGLVNEGEGFTKISVIFSDFCYVISMSNRKIHVAMRSFSLTENRGVAPNAQPSEPYLIDLQVPNNNSINS